MALIYDVRQIEVGVFLASPAVGEKMPHLSWIHVPGLPVDQVQFWRLSVSSSADSREHILVMAHYPQLSTPTCAEIRRVLRPAYPGMVLSFAHSDSEGRSELSAESHPDEVAAAIAEVKRSGSWDESDVFRILVEGRSFDVRLRWITNSSEASVEETAG
jgi:hypothetical protein